jgi:hypothetical protein
VLADLDLAAPYRVSPPQAAGDETKTTAARGRPAANASRSAPKAHRDEISRVVAKIAGETGAVKRAAVAVGRARVPRRAVQAVIARGGIARIPAAAGRAVSAAAPRETGLLAPTGLVSRAGDRPYGRSRTAGSGPTGRPTRTCPAT